MIKITEQAAKQVAQIKSEDQSANEKPFLRVEAVMGGCSGMSYKLEFSADKSDDDKTFAEHGVTVVVDKKSYLYLVGMTLDYQGGLNGQGFVFNNPNASRTCGCGASFGV